MKLTDTHTGIELLDEDQCLRLLASEEVGRLAVIHGSSPAICPVNFALDGRNIVFRTNGGTKVDHGPRSGASFEIDGFDRSTRSGWSVVVSGRLEEITRFDSRGLAAAEALAIDPWAMGVRSHFIRLVPDTITGRRVGRAEVVHTGFAGRGATG